MRRRSRLEEPSSIAYRDFLSGIMALLMGALLLAKTADPQDEASAKAAGDLSVTIDWPNDTNDVDVWVLPPGAVTPIYYNYRAGQSFNLVRDDRGTFNDASNRNRENGYSRGVADGEWVVNLVCFSCGGLVPVEVEVLVGNNGENAKRVIDPPEKFVLKNDQQVTAVRFKTLKGKVVEGSVNHTFIDLRGGKRP